MKGIKLLKSTISWLFVFMLSLGLFLQFWFKSFHFSIDFSSFLYWLVLLFILWLNLVVKKITLNNLFFLALFTFLFASVLELVFLYFLAEAVLRFSLILWVYAILGSLVNLVRKKNK